MTTVDDALALARHRRVERLEAQMMLAHVLGQQRSWLAAHGDAVLPPEQQTQFEALLQRCAAGEPLAYVLGEKEFHGLQLHLTPAVLVPRADTETLVDWALELIPSHAAFKILDMGTGSGAVALALKQRRPQASITALDISQDALDVAQRNAARLGLPVRWIQSDWWHSLEGERFDLIVTNPPYIAESDPHLAALKYEPLLALTSGPDGLDALRHIAAHAHQHLEPEGWLLFEHGYEQAEAVAHLLRSGSFSAISTRRDMAGHERCTGGQRNGT